MEIGVFEGILLFAVLLGAYHWGRISMLTEIINELKAKGVLPDKLEEAKSEGSEEIIKVERHQGAIYAFGANDRFLGQGPTYDELFESIKQRFPGQNFRVHKDGAEDAEFEKMVTSIFKTFGDKHDKSN